MTRQIDFYLGCDPILVFGYYLYGGDTRTTEYIDAQTIRSIHNTYIVHSPRKSLSHDDTKLETWTQGPAVQCSAQGNVGAALSAKREMKKPGKCLRRADIPWYRYRSTFRSWH